MSTNQETPHYAIFFTLLLVKAKCYRHLGTVGITVQVSYPYKIIILIFSPFGNNDRR